MEWIKKHTDTVLIIAAIVGSLNWMNGKMNDMNKEIHSISTDVAVMKTVLIMKGIMPDAYAYKNAEIKPNS